MGSMALDLVVVMGCSRDPLPAAKMTACILDSPVSSIALASSSAFDKTSIA
jgi:hypothetical protein